jgi:hypothetical protein
MACSKKESVLAYPGPTLPRSFHLPLPPPLPMSASPLSSPGSSSSALSSCPSSARSILRDARAPSSSTSSFFSGTPVAATPAVLTTTTRLVKRAKPRIPTPVVPVPEKERPRPPRTKKRREPSPAPEPGPSRKAPRLERDDDERPQRSSARRRVPTHKAAAAAADATSSDEDAVAAVRRRGGSRSASAGDGPVEIAPIPRDVSIAERFNPFPGLKTPADVVAGLGPRYYETCAAVLPAHAEGVGLM